jgi:hypothetical protein
MKAGTIIKQIHQVHNYPERDGEKLEYTYFELRNGKFRVLNPSEDYMTFKGLHFVCLGSTYFVDIKGIITGFEILAGEHEIVTEAPNDLKP